MNTEALVKMAFSGEQFIKFLKRTLGGATRAINKNPKTEQMLRKMLSYRIADPANQGKNTLAGAATGAGVAGIPALDHLLSGDQTPKPHIRDLVEGKASLQPDSVLSRLPGALGLVSGGAGLGAAGGRWLPGLAQKGVGRVVTNLFDPYIYTFDDKLRNVGAKDMVKAIWQDKPLWMRAGEDGYDLKSTGVKARAQLYREMFNLKPWDWSEGALKNVSKGVHKFNPSDPAAMAEIKDIAQQAQRFTPNRAKGKSQLLHSGTLGHFHAKPSGDYEDVWDVGLNPNEKLDSLEHLARGLIDPWTNPSKVVGKTTSEAVAMRNRGSKPIGDLHESYLTNFNKRLTGGAGIPADNLARFTKDLDGKAYGGNRAALHKEIGKDLQNKPVNYLQGLANSFDVSNKDMRVLMGAQPKSQSLASQLPDWQKFDVGNYAKKHFPQHGAKLEQIRQTPGTEEYGMLRDLLQEHKRKANPNLGGDLEALATL